MTSATNFYLNQLRPLVGGTISALARTGPNEDASEDEFFGFVVTLPDGTTRTIILLADDEGNAWQRKIAKLAIEKLSAMDMVGQIHYNHGLPGGHQWHIPFQDVGADRKKMLRLVDSMEPGDMPDVDPAFELALKELANEEYQLGTKHIILISDGVDLTSTDFQSEQNLKLLEETGVTIYPLRLDSRRETEARIRQQQGPDSTVVVNQVIKGVPNGTTPTTVPGETPVPTLKRTPVADRIGIPPDSQGRYPNGRRAPGDPSTGPVPRGRFPSPGPTTTTVANEPDSEGPGPLLDRLYSAADKYLSELATRSGGLVIRVDELGQLMPALNTAATDLKSVYSLAYVSSNQMRTGRYRKLSVKVLNSEAVVRTRPGYREGKD